MINKKNKGIKPAGFTLVELIISGAIILLVSVTVYSVFASGINVWRKANQVQGKGHALRLVIEKMSREIRNTFRFSTIPFEGSENIVYFPQVVDSQLSRIIYFIDEEENFCRRLQSYPEVFEKGESGKYDILISGLKELKFEYCYLDNASGEYEWKDKWVKEEQDTIPQAIKIEFTFEGQNGEELKFAKTVFVPIGTGEQKIELIQ
ncbi:MAG: type II secretion system protein [Candidatus Omnitrophota bacterium]